ncbi:YtxH domain-containing protein [Candidatus Dojkabacteria bacterium]|nr:YtxH domain-containing protein [Candidatus Dojkabacteria bacterium]
MDSKTDDTLSFIAGGILGIAVGTVIGLLFAPSTGEQTRKKLKKHTRELAKEVNTTIKKIDKENIKPQLNTVTKYVREQIDKTAEEIKNKTDEVKDFAEEKINQTKKKI